MRGYQHEAARLASVDRLPGDEALAARLRRRSTHLQASPGTALAADLVERTALAD